jgi:hemerythrin
MPVLTWDVSFEIGIPAIDEQHKKLVELANEAQAQVEAGADRGATEKALRALCDYTVEHFASEETYMDPEGYPDYDGHLMQHMECTTQALDFLETYSEGKTVAVAEFLSFVATWVRDHILQTDKRFGEYYLSAQKRA